MRNSIFCPALLFFFATIAFGQASSDPGVSEFPRGYDPLLLWDLQNKGVEGGWPDDNHPVRDWNDNGSRSTVSLKELQHKIPKAAMKEYDKAAQAIAKGKLSLATEHLENAIKMDPGFSDAHNDLGVTMANLGHTDHATAEFQKAVDLAPKNVPALSNLSVALYFQKRYHEACQVARRALESDSTLAQVRFVFGVSLIADHGDAKEALVNLDRAAPEYPEAHIAASNLLIKIGRTDEAARHLQAYLRSPQSDNTSKAQVQERLAQLRE